ncbi:hypothetical protein ABK040_008902 [Willaertia magna]
MFLKRNQRDYNNDQDSSMYSSSFKGDSILSLSYMPPSTLKGIHKKNKSKERSIAKTFVKRFIYNTKTTKILMKEDTVMINIDDELSILHSLDPQLHGKLAIVKDIMGDDLELELLGEEDDFDKSIIVPSFCVCLEDKVLKQRLTQIIN